LENEKKTCLSSCPLFTGAGLFFFFFFFFFFLFSIRKMITALKKSGNPRNPNQDASLPRSSERGEQDMLFPKRTGNAIINKFFFFFFLFPALVPWLSAKEGFLFQPSVRKLVERIYLYHRKWGRLFFFVIFGFEAKPACDAGGPNFGRSWPATQAVAENSDVYPLRLRPPIIGRIFRESACVPGGSCLEFV